MNLTSETYMILTKRYWILVGVLILIIFLIGTFVHFGWSKQKSEPASFQPEQTKQEPEQDSSQPDQIKPELIKRIMISSSLDPYNIMAQFVPYIPPWGESITEDHLFWPTEFWIPYPCKGFVKGFSTSWVGLPWIKKDNTIIKPPDDPYYGFILKLAVLEYEKPEFSKDDFNRISNKQDFRDWTFQGLKLKTKVGSEINMNLLEELKPDQYQQSLIYSNNFIIYAFGLKEAVEDTISRLIDRYEMK